MLAEWFVRIAGENPVVQALVGGVVIALLNVVGASLVVVWRDPSERALDGALGFAAGVMLSASFTSLILPGIDFANRAGYRAIEIGGVPVDGIYPVVVGLLLGVLLLDRADVWVPHVHFLITGNARTNGTPAENAGAQRAVEEVGVAAEPATPGETESPSGSTDAGSPSGSTDAGSPSGPVDAARLSSVVLFIVAITLHNMPEGLAVGVAFGSGRLGEALPLMIAIGLQNVPEGLAVAVAARNAGLGSLWYAAFTGVRAGLVEIPVAVFGAWAVLLAEPVLPYAMGFAAGGMLYVISDEIIPETHGRGYERVATLGTMAGVVVMLYLDVVLA